MYALLILDIQVGLIHGPEKPWRCDELLETLNTLMDKARSAGAPIFLARRPRWLANRTRQPAYAGCTGTKVARWRSGVRKASA